MAKHHLRHVRLPENSIEKRFWHHVLGNLMPATYKNVFGLSFVIFFWLDCSTHRRYHRSGPPIKMLFLGWHYPMLHLIVDAWGTIGREFWEGDATKQKSVKKSYLFTGEEFYRKDKEWMEEVPTHFLTYHSALCPFWGGLETKFRKHRGPESHGSWSSMEDWHADLPPCNFASTHFLQKEGVSSPCNFATAHLTACILSFNLPLSSRLGKWRTLSPGSGGPGCLGEGCLGFPGQVWELRLLPSFFLHFLGKMAVQKMSGKTPASPRHLSTRHPRPAYLTSRDEGERYLCRDYA